MTVTGLAIALGFTSRQALLNYQGRKKFQAIVEAAKLRIENYAEMRLYDKEGANGAKFNLQNNFRQWDADKAGQDDKKAPAVNIICDIPRVTAHVADDQDGLTIDPEAVDKAIKELEGKGGDSIRYGIKWLQSLKKIVIDPARCPETAKEFQNYEYERTDDGDIISGYPDKDNHSIDSVRYAMERVWRRKGQ